MWTAGAVKQTHGNSSSLGLLEKAYSMTLVVIVGAYSICLQTAARVRRIDKTNIATLKLYVASYSLLSVYLSFTYLAIFRSVHSTKLS